jgi:hypothetical protein
MKRKKRSEKRGERGRKGDHEEAKEKEQVVAIVDLVEDETDRQTDNKPRNQQLCVVLVLQFFSSFLLVS